jgi:hypothetical protein
MRAILFATSALLLAGCTTAQPSAPECPPVKIYSQTEQNALAVAVAGLPPDNPLIGAMLDYGRLRAAASACAKP